MLALGVVDEEHDDCGHDADGSTDVEQSAEAMHDDDAGDAAPTSETGASRRGDVDEQTDEADNSGDNSEDEEG